ncbi:hypothetical protein T06_12444 [Trichinella sp. T6]|nr:hypothetical protein T06_12444 [Trichinella sp. T6]
MSADKSSLSASSFEFSLEVPRGASASVENESNTLNVHKQILPEIQSSCSDLSFYSVKKKELTPSYLHTKNSSINSPYSTLTVLSPWRSSTPILPQLLKMKLPQPTLSSIGYSNDSPILHYQRNVHFINSEEIYFTSEEPQESNTGKYASTCSPFKNCIKSPPDPNRRATFRRSIRASFDDFAGRLSVRYCGGDPIFFTSTFSTIG